METFEKYEGLQQENESSPDFWHRYTAYSASSGIAPIRAYFHRCGSEAFAEPEVRDELPIQIGHHLKISLSNNHKYLEGAKFMIAVMWGDLGDKMIDLFKYDSLDNWSDNPEVSSFIIRNGVCVPKEKTITCGDGLIVLGAEERFRRDTKNLDEYMGNSFEISGLIIKK